MWTRNINRTYKRQKCKPYAIGKFLERIILLGNRTDA